MFLKSNHLVHSCSGVVTYSACIHTKGIRRTFSYRSHSIGEDERERERERGSERGGSRRVACK